MDSYLRKNTKKPPPPPPKGYIAYRVSNLGPSYVQPACSLVIVSRKTPPSFSPWKWKRRVVHLCCYYYLPTYTTLCSRTDHRPRNCAVQDFTKRICYLICGLLTSKLFARLYDVILKRDANFYVHCLTAVVSTGALAGSAGGGRGFCAINLPCSVRR